MVETQSSPTKSMFESLAKLYKLSQLLLMDADRLMGERGWEPGHSSAPAEMSISLNSPFRWYPRWAARFYVPRPREGEDTVVDRVLFVSIHFASDVDTSMKTEVDEPLISAGRLLYAEPVDLGAIGNFYDYWMCKYWFMTSPHGSLKGWRNGGPSRLKDYANLKGNETFVVPLYDIGSSEKLEELVVNPLLTAGVEA
ncbi:MAG: hypothetical protein O3A47_09110 [Chloroflexi bacterium]|nr:hypothetical protein [Chloroflexota bacterium]